MSRRELFRALARWALGGAVAGTAVAMAARKRCDNKGICQACGLWESCVLPQAMSYRQYREDRKVG